MARKSALAVLLVAISLIGVGCVFTSVPPDPPLSKAGIDSIINCQDFIMKEGRAFMKVKFDNLETCLDKVLKQKLLFENGLITENKYESELASIRNQCLGNYQLITAASFKLANNISVACQTGSPVFSAYDPLQFQALAAAAGISLATGNELGGAICKVKEDLVDLSVALQVPRMVELLVILGLEAENNLYDFYVQKHGLIIPNIVLHDTCKVNILQAELPEPE